jgi:hypothetical protein
MVREQKIKVQFSDRIIEYQLPNWFLLIL